MQLRNYFKLFIPVSNYMFVKVYYANILRKYILDYQQQNVSSNLFLARSKACCDSRQRIYMEQEWKRIAFNI